MQQTETYKLNLIETSDAFSPTPINENTQAIEAALGELGQKIDGRIVLGGYTGNGASSRTISLGFTPKLVILFGSTLVGFFTDSLGYGIAQATAGTVSCRVVSGGFTTPSFNTSGSAYTYFAFR